MSSNQQILLALGGGAFAPPVQTCVGDPYYAQSTEFPQGPDALYSDTVLWFQAEDPTGQRALIDNSSYANSISISGTPTASFIDYAFKRQGLSAHYGDNMILQVPDAAHLRMNTADFYAEAWVYITGYALASSVCVVFGQENATAASGRWFLGIRPPGMSNPNRLHFYYEGSGILLSSSTVPTNQWVLLAVSVSSGTIRIFIDGVLQGATARPGSFSAATGWRIRGSGSGTTSFSGWLDALRVIKGQAVYTASYTPATPPTDQFGLTQLSLHGAAIADSSVDTKTLTNFGVTVSTAQARFGGSSLSFDGSSYLKVTPLSPFSFVSSAYTVETWVYPTSFGVDRVIFSICANDAANFAAITLAVFANGAVRASVRPTTGGTLVSATSAAGAVVLNTWTNIAFTRSGANAYVFVNGVLVASSSAWVDYPSASVLHVGVGGSGNGNTSAGSRFAGFVDDLRVTAGVARYVADYAPLPTITYCDSVNSQFSGQTNGEDRLSSQVVTTSQGTIRILNPWVRLEGQAITTAAGALSSVLPNRTQALTGQQIQATQGIAQTANRTTNLSGSSVSALQGTPGSAPYPNLNNATVSVTQRIPGISGSICTVTVSTDGTFSVVGLLGGTLGSGTWIDTSGGSFSIPAIASQYQIERIIPLSVVELESPALPANLGSAQTVRVPPEAPRPSDVSFIVVIGPTSSNPRFGEPGYNAQIAVRLNIRNT